VCVELVGEFKTLSGKLDRFTKFELTLFLTQSGVEVEQLEYLEHSTLGELLFVGAVQFEHGIDVVNGLHLLLLDSVAFSDAEMDQGHFVPIVDFGKIVVDFCDFSVA